MTTNDIEKKSEILPAEAIQIENAVKASSHHPVEKSKAEKKLVRKIDFLVPAILGGAYFFAYLVWRAATSRLCNTAGLLTIESRTEVPLGMPE